MMWEYWVALGAIFAAAVILHVKNAHPERENRRLREVIHGTAWNPTKGPWMNSQN